jgi:hypothetical protein
MGTDEGCHGLFEDCKRSAGVLSRYTVLKLSIGRRPDAEGIELDAQFPEGRDLATYEGVRRRWILAREIGKPQFFRS